ncbi:MAG: hypothetical protein VX757_12650, partial [Planctomycetota bacterium]|nr:hypothetical protein [Planctomycetota bacterium]
MQGSTRVSKTAMRIHARRARCSNKQQVALLSIFVILASLDVVPTPWGSTHVLAAPQQIDLPEG